MAPSRPALYPDQVGLLFCTLVVLGVGAYFLVRSLLA